MYSGERLAVNKDRFIIGRGKQSSDLTIKDPNVSRQHAMVEFLNGQYYMVDMGSTNGVEYNGQRIARKASPRAMSSASAITRFVSPTNEPSASRLGRALPRAPKVLLGVLVSLTLSVSSRGSDLPPWREARPISRSPKGPAAFSWREVSKPFSPSRRRRLRVEVRWSRARASLFTASSAALAAPRAG